MSRVLHQIWLGEKLPDYASLHQESFKNANPSWKIKLWRDSEVEPVVSRFPKLFRIYRECSTIIRADLARLCIIHSFGGLYADLDVEFFRSVDSLFLRGRPTTFFREATTGLVTNSIFFSNANTACLQDILSKIRESPQSTRSIDVLNFAGPHFLTNNIKPSDLIDIKSHIYFEYSPINQHVFQYGFHKYAKSWMEIGDK